MAIKLLHTADWQVGKSFAGIEGDAGAALRAQRLKTVERLARLATEHRVDAVLVAGDVCDTNAISDETLRRLINAMSPFVGPWILLPGNHDAALAESVWSRFRRLDAPDNIHLAIKREPILLFGESLAVLPAPLERRHEASDVTEWFDAAETPAHAMRVGLAHGSVANRLPRPSESPNTIADDRSMRARLDYFALGDWHGTLEIAPRTWYSGTPEPDRFRDNDPGNVLIVTLNRPGTEPFIEKIPVGHFRWLSIEHDISSEQDAVALDATLTAEPEPERIVANLRIAGVVDFAIRQSVEEAIERHKARYHVLRVDTDTLNVVPSDDDLDRIDTVGFVREAIDDLRRRISNPTDPERDLARAALQRLYLEHMRLGR